MGVLVALRFLTILPLPGPAVVSERRLGRAAAWYPLVGVILGLVLAAVVWSGRLFWGPLGAAAIAVAAGAVLTRGLHLDGLADSFDGLGGATRERRLQIMKDSRVGVFGVLALILCLLLKFVFLAEIGTLLSRPAGPAFPLPVLSSPVGDLRPPVGDLRLPAAVARIAPLAAVPVLGRWAMLLTLFAFPPAVREGLGFRVKQHCRWPQLLIGTATVAAWCYLTAGLWGLAGLALAACVAALFGLLFTRRLGGLTGDSHGAVCELTELAALAALVMAARCGTPA